MELKTFWAKTNSWLKNPKSSRIEMYNPKINNEGLIDGGENSATATIIEEPKPKHRQDHITVKTIQPAGNSASLEKLQEGFNTLVEQLRDINCHLSNQVAQYESLANQIDKMPKLLDSFPSIIENQKIIAEQLIEQLKATSIKDQQFIDSIGKIPVETAKQTDTLVNIDNQLAAAADTDVQLTENFNKFNENLGKLDQATNNQTDSILQMSKTFATSDRYLKYLVSRQNKRFMWIFISAMSICVLAILTLAGIVIYIK